MATTGGNAASTLGRMGTLKAEVGRTRKKVSQKINKIQKDKNLFVLVFNTRESYLNISTMYHIIMTA